MMSSTKCLDLFCGRGGWSKGFIEHRYDCTGIDTRDLGYPGRFIKADILDWEPDQDYDIVLASPPCSEFSVVKRNTATYPYDERIGLDLVWRAFYLIQKIKPKWWVLENVPGLGEFLGPPKDKVRYAKRVGAKTAFLYGNFPDLGFFNEQIKHKAINSHKSGWLPSKDGSRAEIPIALSRQMAKVMI